MSRLRKPSRRHLPGPAWLATLLLAVNLATAQTSSVSARSVPLVLPGAIAYDTAGNLYIAETQHHDVRKVDTLGNISTIVGTGTQGFAGDGSAAASAQLDSPQGLAVDNTGDVFISDSSNNRIRRVDAVTGIITTVVGNGHSAFSGDGGVATSASLSVPRALCLNQAGTYLYIADTHNHRIRRVNLATGIIGTIAGSGAQGYAGDGGPALAASLDSPDSIALDRSDNLYIADTHNQRIRRVEAATGLISTIAGTGAVGLASGTSAASAAPLALPRGLAVDTSGNLYIADAGNHRIVELTQTSGHLTLIAGGAAEGFAGDSGPAVTASLDSPHAVALSPGGLVTLADSNNQRVRQLLAAPASATPIQTIAGLGQAVPGIFLLSAPSVIAYGSGTVTLTLNSGLPATGQVTLLDATSGSDTVLGLGQLSANTATISLAAVPVGQHHILATYAGDASHASTETSTALLTVTPLPLTATPAAASMLYGAPVPALTGTLTGILAQDTTRLSATFTSTVTPASAVGAYPISATLTGAAAANYTLQTTPAQLVIHQAPSATRLTSSSTDSAGALQILVSSSTSGIPTGAVTLLDNGASLGNVTLTSAGAASFTAANLGSGIHTLTASYAGDGNFLPSTSAPVVETIPTTPAADFTVALVGSTSQQLLAGASVTYSLSLAPIGGGPPSQIALAVSGLPAFTNAAFNPAYIPPGISGTATTVLTITSLATSAQSTSGFGWSTAVLATSLPLLGLVFRLRSRQRIPNLALLLAAAFLLSSAIGCGDRINTKAQAGTVTQSYPITITGTATSATGTTLQHAVTATLVTITSQ